MTKLNPFWTNQKPFRFQRNCINHYIKITSIFHLCSSKIPIDFRRKTRTSRFEATFTISCYFICQSWKRPGRLFVAAWEGESLLPSHVTSGSTKSHDSFSYRQRRWTPSYRSQNQACVIELFHLLFRQLSIFPMAERCRTAWDWSLDRTGESMHVFRIEQKIARIYCPVYTKAVTCLSTCVHYWHAR